MAATQVKIKPLPVPDFVTLEMPAGRKEDGPQPLPTLPIEAVDPDALEELAYEWLCALYAARGKSCPFYRPARCADEKR